MASALICFKDYKKGGVFFVSIKVMGRKTRKKVWMVGFCLWDTLGLESESHLSMNVQKV